MRGLCCYVGNCGLICDDSLSNIVKSFRRLFWKEISNSKHQFEIQIFNFHSRISSMFFSIFIEIFFKFNSQSFFSRVKMKKLHFSKNEEETNGTFARRRIRVFSWNDDLEYDLSWCAVPRGINFFLLPQTGDTFVFAVCDPRGSKNVSHFRRFVLIYGARSTPRKWKRTLFLGREEPVKRHERWNTRHFHAMTFQVSRTTNLHPSKNCSITFQIFVFRRQIESFHDYYYPSRGIIMIKPLNVFIDSINCVFELNYYIGLTKLVSVLK